MESKRFVTTCAGCIALAIGTVLGLMAATPSAGGQRVQEGMSYDEWVRDYRRGPLQVQDGNPLALGSDDGNRAMLVITAVEGDELEPDERTVQNFGPNGKHWTEPPREIVRYGCSVSQEGRIAFFQYQFNYGPNDSDVPVIPREDLERLKVLIAKLPDDHSHLPPAGRRLVLQAFAGNRVLARVYDRANLPEGVLEVLRLSESHITSWALKFNVQSEWKTGDEGNLSGVGAGALAVSPDGSEIISVTRNGPLRFWDAESHTMVNELQLSLMPAQGNYARSPAIPRGLTFSVDGSIAIVGNYGNIDVRDSRSWQGIRKLEVDEGRHPLSNPQFTPDARFLLLQSDEPALHIYDTKTWEPQGSLPQLPRGAVAYFPSKNGARAVYISRTGTIKLWNPRMRRDVAQLDDNGSIIDVSFAPDQSLVAVVTFHESQDTKSDPISRIRVWRTGNGKLLHELRPCEQTASGANGVRWWPNGKYLLAGIGNTEVMCDNGIGLWDVETGRFRAVFVGCGYTNQVAILPDRKGLVEVCDSSTIKFWDVASAIEHIEQFQASDQN